MSKVVPLKEVIPGEKFSFVSKEPVQLVNGLTLSPHNWVFKRDSLLNYFVITNIDTCEQFSPNEKSLYRKVTLVNNQ